jgi:nicotinate phosphoribosyltransferase
MSIGDGKRLDPGVFKLDFERMRRGWYSDAYFINVRDILAALAAQGYRFGGTSALLDELGVDPRDIETGNMEVEMQFFTKREPFSIVAGADNAIAMLRLCAGFFDARGAFVGTWDALEVEAVQDGTKLAPWMPAMRVRGRYRDFGILETPILGAIARRTRIATNVFQTLVAARGKTVLFFPARFDIHETQAGDGYAYRVAIEAYNREAGTRLLPFISTDSQGDWWGESGGGTVSHSYILCFLKDSVEAMLKFAEIVPPSTKRIVLVDTDNDCVRESVATARAMFRRYMECCEQGRADEAERYVLYAVRPDTAGDMVDASIDPIGDPGVDYGVNPRLVWNIRRALDAADEGMALPDEWRGRAREYFRAVKIVATGGFRPERIRLFESLGVPVDIYGVGSYLMRGENNDFTADIVRVKINGAWHDMAKAGRRAINNPDLERVT